MKYPKRHHIKRIHCFGPDVGQYANAEETTRPGYLADRILYHEYMERRREQFSQTKELT